MPPLALVAPRTVPALIVRPEVKVFAPVKVNWQVALDSLAYIDLPNHEEGLPNYLKSRQALTDFENLMVTTPGLDINSEALKLQGMLQAIYHQN